MKVKKTTVMWVEAKIDYEKMMENGVTRRVTETYLVDAFSITEAEKRLVDEMEALTVGDCSIVSLKHCRYHETFFNSESEYIYKVRISLITLDERTGLEKKKTVSLLVQADTVDEAIAALHAGMKNTMADYRTVSVAETPIMDILISNDYKL